MIYRKLPEIEKKYNCKRWKDLRKQKKIISPFCERCLKKGIYNSVYIVHHKEWINDKNYLDDNIFYNIDNLESLCQACHNQEHFEKKEEYFFDEEGNLVKSTPH